MFHRKKTHFMKTESKKGTSLVIVVCVSAFLVAFALAMIYTAGLMLSQANKRLRQERCYQLAKSFAETLDYELTRFESPQQAKADPDGGNSFYLFTCRFLEMKSYLDYNPNDPANTIYHYSAGENPAGDKNYGDITIALYKENDWDGRQTFSYSSTSGAAGNPDTVAGSIARYTLTVEVTVRADNMSYSYSTVYNQSAAYDMEALVFYHNGNRISWDSTDKQWKDNLGALLSVPENDPIEYEIKPFTAATDFDWVTGYKFNKTIRESGETETEGGEGETGGGEAPEP